MKNKKVRLIDRINQQKFLLLLLLPALLWYLLFRYIPMMGNFLALTNFGSSIHIKFVGLKNFIRLFQSLDFYRAFNNTLILSFANIVFYFPLPIILAILMNELYHVKMKRLVQFIVYIPYFFSWVVVGSIFITMLSPTSGIINKIIEFFGGKSIYFMVSTFWFRPILIISYIWRQVGYGTVIYIATISTIDPELYDAAKVDGANHFQRVLHVTLPCIKSTIATMLLLNLSHVLLIFDQIIVMQNAAVYAVSDVLRTYSYREGLENMNIAYGIAVGLLTSLATAILVLSTNKASKKFLDESVF
ncbi:MAG: sugar ABC transporter permease [Spirochaetes bacterium]|nr:sugar ABC transporter permease [Spirochaetota bacterium]